MTTATKGINRVDYLTSGIFIESAIVGMIAKISPYFYLLLHYGNVHIRVGKLVVQDAQVTFVLDSYFTSSGNLFCSCSTSGRCFPSKQAARAATFECLSQRSFLRHYSIPANAMRLLVHFYPTPLHIEVRLIAATSEEARFTL